MRVMTIAAGVVLGLAPLASQSTPASQSPLASQFVPLELDGWPVVVLTRARRPNGEVWIGTYGHGILVKGPGQGPWRQIKSDTTSKSLSWDFIHAIAFGPTDQIWVGTIGNGWGLSHNDGKTWRNWTFNELGPEWQYVAREGIITHGDTTVIATADGLQITTNDGRNWIAVVDSTGPPAKGPADTAIVFFANEYISSIEKSGPIGGQPQWPQIGLSRLACGLASIDRYWETDMREVFGTLPATPGHTQHHLDRRPRFGRAPPTTSMPESRPWWPPFARPIPLCDNPHIDQTYRWGSTMGGNFQPHQGVEFNNPDGTMVLAIGDGVVAWSGPAERGALTVSIRHDSLLRLPDGTSRFVFSAYYHNSVLSVSVGDRVVRGQKIAEVGHSGRATNDHLHLEVHASPVDSVAVIVDPEMRFPPYATNPELWIEPLQGRGAIAGQVFDSAGVPVPQARIYGINKPLPLETPFAFAETYGPRNKPSPMYGEHFAISDVPYGVHKLRAKIGDIWVEREVSVVPGKLTWVEFRP